MQLPTPCSFSDSCPSPPTVCRLCPSQTWWLPGHGTSLRLPSSGLRLCRPSPGVASPPHSHLSSPCLPHLQMCKHLLRTSLRVASSPPPPPLPLPCASLELKSAAIHRTGRNVCPTAKHPSALSGPGTSLVCLGATLHPMLYPATLRKCPLSDGVGSPRGLPNIC